MKRAEVKLVQQVYGAGYGLTGEIFDDHVTYGINDDYYDYDTPGIDDVHYEYYDYLNALNQNNTAQSNTSHPTILNSSSANSNFDNQWLARALDQTQKISGRQPLSEDQINRINVTEFYQRTAFSYHLAV